jgi:hypothetical protein
VDGNPDGAQLKAAIASRRELDLVGIARGIEYRDDEWGSAAKTLGDVSPYSAREAIESSGTPMYVWVSWPDSGTAEGALSRYQTFSRWAADEVR